MAFCQNKFCRFSSLSIFCLECKTISRRAARWLIVLHPKQNIESELKWQTCYILGSKCIKVRHHKNAVHQVKGFLMKKSLRTMQQLVYTFEKANSPFHWRAAKFAWHGAKSLTFFCSLCKFCLGCKTISRLAARWLIVLHPKQNLES